MKRFNIVANGYDVNEVNKFVDLVISKLEKLKKENDANALTIEKLNRKLEEANVIDDKLKKAIFAIEETSERMKELAKEESRMIIEDAKRNANAIVHEALVSATKTENERDLLKKNITVYKNRVKSLIQAQLEIAEDLDKMDIS